jgi:DNA-binding transcriptional MerR regulator
LGYTAIQASRFSGCTAAQLDAWERSGVVVPSDLATDPAAPYSFRDLVAVRMVASLLDAGLPMTRVKRAVTELVRAGHDLAELSLVSDGESVWACRDDGEILDALRHGQLALFVAVDRFADEVDAEVRAFDSDRRAFVETLSERAAHPARGRPAEASNPEPPASS